MKKRRTIALNTDEPLDAPVSKPQLSLDELEAIDQQRQKDGQELAEKIYKLTQVKRETDIAVYVKTIHDAVLQRTSEENQAILETAADYFLETYGPKIRAQGYSPTMLDQIIRRTGKSTRPQITELVAGFDAVKIAYEIWDFAIRRDPRTLKEASWRMFKLTQQQVGELRRVYNIIPAQLLARQLHTALTRTNLRDEPFPDVDSIQYILKGRSQHEVQQIEFQFNEMYSDLKKGQGEKPLREQIKERLSEEDQGLIDILIDGFNPKALAEKVFEYLENCAEVGEFHDEDFELHQDFAGRFRRSYACSPTWEKEMRAWSGLDVLLRHLTPEQFKELNRLLKRKYKFKLNPALYTCNRDFDPRKTALDLYKACFNIDPRPDFKRDEQYLSTADLRKVKEEFRLSSNNELREIVRYQASEVKGRESLRRVKNALVPLDHLNPTEVFFVKEEFMATTGCDLVEFVSQAVEDICRKDVSKYVQKFVDSRLDGSSRLPLTADLFDLFASKDQRKQNVIDAKAEAEARAEAEEYATKFIGVLSDSGDEEEIEKKILKFLRKHSYEKLMNIEKSYLDLSEDNIPLLRVLEARFPADVFTEMNVLLSGFDPIACAKKIKRSRRQLAALTLQSPEAITLTLKFYEEMFGCDLFSEVRQGYEEGSEPEEYAHALAVLYTPQVAELKDILSTDAQLEDDELATLLGELDKGPLEILAYETSYNGHFSRFVCCYERYYGTILHRLRLLATQEAIPREYFSRSILLLENLDQRTTLDLYALLRNGDTPPEELAIVQEIFRQNSHGLQTVKKSYNALDDESTLREAIYSLCITLEAKNKTLLLLDGYDPDAVAAEINELVQRHTGEKLGTSICEILERYHDEERNPRFPKSSNWIDEMYHQVRRNYEQTYGQKIITTLQLKSVPLKEQGVNTIAYTLYGQVAKQMVDLRKLMKIYSQSPPDKVSERARKIVRFLQLQIPPLRERLVDMYDAYFTLQPNKKPLRESLLSGLKDPAVKSRAIKILDECQNWDVPSEPKEAESPESEGEEEVQQAVA